MKTDELIAAMTADAKAVSWPIGRSLWLAAGVGAVMAAIAFMMEIGPRPDLSYVLETPRFLFKYVLTVSLFVTAMGLMIHLARPGGLPRAWLLALAIPPILLIGGVIVEFIVVPPAGWYYRIVGMNSSACLTLIPLLSAAPLVALLFAMRQGATTHPVFAGASAGLVSAGIGATLYATHCSDDSALFIGVWYVIAVAIVTAVGAAIGSWLLRW